MNVPDISDGHLLSYFHCINHENYVRCLVNELLFDVAIAGVYLLGADCNMIPAYRGASFAPVCEAHETHR